MKLKSQQFFLIVVLFFGVFVCGCTNNVASDDSDSMQITDEKLNSDPIQSETQHNSIDETNPQTAIDSNSQIEENKVISQPEVTAGSNLQGDELIYKKNIVMYPFDFTSLDFKEFTGIERSNCGEMYRIEIESEKPVNLVVLKSLGSFLAIEDVRSWPKWSSDDRKWKYFPGTQTVVKEDSVIKKTVEFTIPEVSSYKLYLDGRVALSDLLQDYLRGDNPFRVNLKIWKISALSPDDEFLINESVGMYDGIPWFMSETGSLPNGWLRIYSFEEDLGIPVSQPGDKYSIKISSEEPVNYIVCNTEQLDTITKNIPTWDNVRNRWHYKDGLYPAIYESEVYDIDKVFEVEDLGKYYLVIDGRISGLVEEAWCADIKFKELN